MSEELTDETRFLVKRGKGRLAVMDPSMPRLMVICEMSCFYNYDGLCHKRGNLHVKRYEPSPFGYMAYCSDYKERMK